MEKVTGYVAYEVRVNCPHCNGRLDLNDYPYDDTDNALGAAIFGGVDTPAKWDDIEIEYQCNHCKRVFILSNVRY